MGGGGGGGGVDIFKSYTMAKISLMSPIDITYLPIRDLLSVGTKSSFVLRVVMEDMPFGYPILNY